MGGKSQTTTSTNSQSYTPAGLSGLQDIWSRLQGVASTPYQAYTGQLVAPVNAQQTTGINAINANANYAQPYIQQAATYANNAAQPLTAAQIQQYQSPYTQQVIDATQAQFNNANKQQEQQVVGNAALQGALGGDRVGVAQAELAKQQQLAQAPVIAGLYNQGYNTALQTAQQQQQNQGAAAYSLGNLGLAGQNAALSGAQSQIGAGTLQQQTAQNQNNAAYQQYLQQLAFPYQNAQFLASYGLPTLLGMGGTQNGSASRTTPGPSPWGQAAGIGLTALGLFAKDGGRIKGYAAGGAATPFSFIDAGGYVPKASAMPMVQQHQMSPMTMPGNSGSSGNGGFSIKGASGGLQNLFSGFNTSQFSAPELLGSGEFVGPLGYSPMVEKRGGRVGSDFIGAVHSIRHAIKGHKYAGGGYVSFDDRFAPAVDLQPAITPYSGETPTQALISGLDAARQPVMRNLGLGQPVNWDAAQEAAPTRAAAGLPTDAIADAPVARSASLMAASVPSPSISPYANDDAAIPPNAQPAQVTPQDKQSPGGSFLSGLFGGKGGGLSDAARQGLLAAGLGMMASRSPFALSAIGEGGLQGIGAYTNARKMEQEKDLTQQRIDLQARQLQQQAENFSKEFGLKQQQFNLTNLQPVKIGTDALGHDIYGIRDPQTGAIRIIDPTTGKPMAPGAGPMSSVTPGAATPSVPAKVDAGGDDASIPAKAKPVQGGFPATDWKPAAPRNEEFLASIPAAARNTVKAIADYRLNPQSLGYRDRTAYLNLVSQYDPTYDMTRFTTINNARKNFAGSGVEARNFASNDMAIKHIGSALDNIEAMGNSTYAPGIANPIRGAIKGQTDPAYQAARKNLEVDTDAVANELMRSFRGSGSASEKEANEWRSKFPINGSPVEQRAAMAEAARLLASRVTASGNRFNDAMGPGNARDPFTWLSPEGQDVIRFATQLDPQKPIPQHWRLVESGLHQQPGAEAASAPKTAPQRVRQNGHTYERQPDGGYKAID